MNEQRSKVRSILCGVVGGGSCSEALETSIYNHTIRTCKKKRVTLNWENPAFKKEYLSKVRSISFNLRNAKNPALLEGLMAGEYTTKDLVEMSHMQMFPALWEEALTKSQKRQVITPEAPREDGMFMCGKCKGYQTTYHQLQTRSADEPMTTFVTCLKCNKRWKF